jgi:hypothetical protein
MSSSRLLAIVTDPLEGIESVEEIRRRGNGNEIQVRLVVPAVEAGPVRHLLGDIDEAKRQAEDRLRTSLAELERHGIGADGSIGDPDPVQAARDALREAPADEVLIFERSGEERWFEGDLFERAQEQLEPPLHLVVLGAEGDGVDGHVVGTEEAGRGILAEDRDGVSLSDNLPRFHGRDLAGILVGIIGTIVVAVLAAVAAADSGTETGWEGAAILIAIGIALLNLAHVVGLTLFQSVHYRSGWGRLFGDVALVATPVAVLVNLLIVLFA